MSRTHTTPHSHSHTITQRHTLTETHTAPHKHSDTLTLTHQKTNTHTHSHTHTLTHFLSLSLSKFSHSAKNHYPSFPSIYYQFLSASCLSTALIPSTAVSHQSLSLSSFPSTPPSLSLSLFLSLSLSRSLSL